MKKILIFGALVLLATVAFAQTLDDRIREAARDVSDKLPIGTNVLVVNVQSDDRSLSEYIVKDMNHYITNIGRLKLIDIANIDAIRAEVNFSLSEEANRANIQRVGRFRSGDYLIFGSIEPVGSQYILRLWAVETQSTNREWSFRENYISEAEARRRANDEARRRAYIRAQQEYQDYTVGERLGMGALNIFGGAGSLRNGHGSGWGVLAAEGVGLISILIGIVIRDEGYVLTDSAPDGSWEEWTDYEYMGNCFIYAGAAIAGAGIIYGFIIPFFHTKPAPRFTENNPFGFELVSSNNKSIDGFKLTYTYRY